jgi:hypothetical protein
MTLHIYLDPELLQPLSEGDGSRPDADDYDGTDGEAKDRELFVANEWGALAAPLDAVQTQLQLAQPRFGNGEFVIVGFEQMLVLSGGGTASLMVERGAGGTSPVPHDVDIRVYSGYDFSGLTIQPIDTAGGDETGWYRLALSQMALDGAAPGAPLVLGAKLHDQTLSFWRRCTVPAGTPVQNKLDLKLRLSGTQRPII